MTTCWLIVSSSSHLIIAFKSVERSVVTLSITKCCSVAKFTINVLAASGSIFELLVTYKDLQLQKDNEGL